MATCILEAAIVTASSQNQIRNFTGNLIIKDQICMDKQMDSRIGMEWEVARDALGPTTFENVDFLLNIT